MYFDGDIGVNLKELDANFEDLKFNDMDDSNALKIVLYYFTDRVLNRRKDERRQNPSLLNIVDDLQYFRSPPWGCESWNIVYDSLDTALNQKLEAFQGNTLKEVKYNIYGFYPEVQVLCLILNNMVNLSYT